MSYLYKIIEPNLKNLKICPDCEKELKIEVFSVQLEKRTNMFKANACEQCNIIYEVLDE